MSSNFTHNISTCILVCIGTTIKIEKSFLDIFDKIWPKTLYTETFAQFLINFKVNKKFNFDPNLLKQEKYMYTYVSKNIKLRIIYLTYKIGNDTVLKVWGLCSIFERL